MRKLKKLFDRIVQRNNINLRELDYDVSPFIKNLVSLNQMVKFYAFYGVTPFHPLDFVFRHSSLAGSYFLGKIRTRNSLLYKSDIRGDELKKQGDVFKYQGIEIPITRDEGIDIEDSFLIKTLVHNFSHDPENLTIAQLLAVLREPDEAQSDSEGRCISVSEVDALMQHLEEGVTGVLDGMTLKQLVLQGDNTPD